jgi:cytochrome c556
MMLRRALVVVAACALLPAIALAEKNPAIGYRQALMDLVYSNFGPITAMVKGEIPWDDARMAGYGKDLKAVVSLNAMRGWPAGSEGGHSKDEIWTKLDDFQKKMEAFQSEASKLGDLAVAGDREAIKTQFSATGKTCKSCHDAFKEKDEH